MPKFSIKDFLTLPVIIVAGLGAIGTLLQWSGHDVVSKSDLAAVQMTRADSLHQQILITLQDIRKGQEADALIKEAQLRGECLENDLEMLARQGLLNACQERNLLIGRAITPEVSAAAASARPLAPGDTIP